MTRQQPDKYSQMLGDDVVRPTPVLPLAKSVGIRAAAIDLRVLWIVTVGVLLDVTWHRLGPLRLGLSDVVLLVFGLTVLFERRRPRLGSLKPFPYMWWLLALAAIIVIMGSLIAALRLGDLPNWTIINRDVGTGIMLGSYCLIVSAPSRPRLVSYFLSWFVTSAAILNVVALLGAAVRYIWDVPNPLMFQEVSLRLAGTMVNPNSYGGYLATVLAAQLSAFVLRQQMLGAPRWIEAANCAALLLGLLLTISRGSWLAALVGTMIVTLFTIILVRRRYLGVGDLVAPMLVVGVLVIVLAISQVGGVRTAAGERGNTGPSPIESRTQIYRPQGSPSIAEFFRIASDRWGFADRMAINQIALKMYWESPWSVLFGIGVGSFLEESAQTILQQRILIHNTYLWVLVELGLVGLITLAGMLVSMIVGLLVFVKRAGASDATPMALLAALSSNLVWFLSTDGLYHRHVWLILALVSLLARVGPGSDRAAGRIVCSTG